MSEFENALVLISVKDWDQPAQPVYRGGCVRDCAERVRKRVRDHCQDEGRPSDGDPGVIGVDR